MVLVQMSKVEMHKQMQISHLLFLGLKVTSTILWHFGLRSPENKHHVRIVKTLFTRCANYLETTMIWVDIAILFKQLKKYKMTSILIKKNYPWKFQSQNLTKQTLPIHTCMLEIK